MAGLLKSKHLIGFPVLERASTANALDNITDFCVIYTYGDAAPNGIEGNVFVLNNGHTGSTQIRVSYKGDIVSVRTYNWSDRAWSAWRNL